MVKKALLIIDMQQGDFPPIKERYRAEETISRIRTLAEAFRKSDLPVIYIQHDGSAEDVFVPQSRDWQIVPELTPKESDLVVSKTANNAFYRSELDSTLKALNISHLVVTGSATDFCVEATVQAALSHDYDITIASDAHTCADRPHVNAARVIAHYNWVWENLTPTKGTVTTRKSKNILTGA